MKKYYITRTDLVTGKVAYKKNKTVDGWAGEGFRSYCWRFSAQGAQKIIKRLNEHRRPGWKNRIEYGVELVES